MIPILREWELYTHLSLLLNRKKKKKSIKKHFATNFPLIFPSIAKKKKFAENPFDKSAFESFWRDFFFFFHDELLSLTRHTAQKSFFFPIPEMSFCSTNYALRDELKYCFACRFKKFASVANWKKKKKKELMRISKMIMQ